MRYRVTFEIDVLDEARFLALAREKYAEAPYLGDGDGGIWTAEQAIRDVEDALMELTRPWERDGVFEQVRVEVEPKKSA